MIVIFLVVLLATIPHMMLITIFKACNISAQYRVKIDLGNEEYRKPGATNSLHEA
ncbi:hypothetical protein [Chitinophaga tropicalis]|uniref:Uncharacterized protein n=1 Tax=Chitinophaga tropicalis TaxID=2683588 RepID=A0A7K1TYP5_9BACT|nr:hypothetical protein [Chitinophaga tropicalis]MVT07160.1 hypothetical protein [Chitinophaga tropicalis]